MISGIAPRNDNLNAIKVNKILRETCRRETIDS